MAMGYVARTTPPPGTALDLSVRGRALPAQGGRPALHPAPLPALAPHGVPRMSDPSYTKSTSGSAWTAATSPPSASPTTRRPRSATWCSSSCPRSGARWARATACAVVESVKAACDVYAPVAGEVVEANERLADDPGLVNRIAEARAGSTSWRSPTRRARRADGARPTRPTWPSPLSAHGSADRRSRRGWRTTARARARADVGAAPRTG